MSDPKPSRRRTHPVTGWAYAGSQRHIQAYVNTPALTTTLNVTLQNALPALADATIEWRAPLTDAQHAEPRDNTFWPAIEQPALAADAKDWWPARGGPSWDAIGIARRTNGNNTVVLIEAKANAPEFGGAPSAAKAATSVKQIAAALAATRKALKVTGSPDDWIGSHYQLANRLAWAHWLRTRDVDTVFAHILFSGDRSHIPTSPAVLRSAAHAAHTTLGVPASALAGWAATIVLPATG